MDAKNKGKILKRFIMSVLLLTLIIMVLTDIKVRAGTEENIIYDKNTKTLKIKNSLTDRDFEKINDFRKITEHIEIKDVKFDRCKRMFKDFNALRDIRIDGLETSDTEKMFGCCNNLSKVDIINWDFSNNRSLYCMFSNCVNLKKLELKNWKLSKAVYMQNMLRNCLNLESAQLNEVKIPTKAYITDIIRGCVMLKEVSYNKYTTYTVHYIYNNNEIESFKKLASFGEEVTELSSDLSELIIDGPKSQTIKIGAIGNTIYFKYRDLKNFNVKYYDSEGKEIKSITVREGDKLGKINKIPTKN